MTTQKPKGSQPAAAAAMKRLYDERRSAGVLARKMLVGLDHPPFVKRLCEALSTKDRRMTEQELNGALASAGIFMALNQDATWIDFVASVAQGINLDTRDVARALSAQSIREGRTDSQLPLGIAS